MIIPIITGPTSSGKSGTAFNAALKTGIVEIISADAFQVYKGLDIGTAKVSKQEMQQVKHHLIDIMQPDECYSAGIFVQQAEELIRQNFEYIEAVAEAVLRSEGFDYTSSSRLDNAQFPTRTYQDITLAAGNYDAVIIDLGSGEGDNWWCLVYPAFCFTKSQNSTNYVYISKIWEIISSIKR